jgi:UrcA family protein
VKIIASLAAVAVLAGAGAAAAQDARVPWSDLNLSTAAGAAAFEARLDAAARRLCRDARQPGSRMGDRDRCIAAFRAEAVRQLPAAAQADLALGRAPLVEG